MRHEPVPSRRLREDFAITQLVKGGYQLSAQYMKQYGPEDTRRLVDEMSAFAAAGITSFDCGDIYVGVEEMIGEFIERRRAEQGQADDITVLTKFVPDYEDLHRIDRAYTERIVDRSLQRLRLERIPLIQFHWWDMQIPGCMDVLQHLADLKAKGKIAHIGVTNFNTADTRAFIDAGFDIVTTQVQYSVLDDRPGRELARLCRDGHAHILCYGSLAGGLLSDRWLGRREPQRPFREKYLRIVDDLGGWERLQAILRVLNGIADRHAASISNVAVRYVLERPGVAAVIIGAHTLEQLEEARAIPGLHLASRDTAEIQAVLAQCGRLEGDVFDLERDMNGRHGEIYQGRRSRHAESGGGV